MRANTGSLWPVFNAYLDLILVPDYQEKFFFAFSVIFPMSVAMIMEFLYHEAQQNGKTFLAESFH